MAHDGDEAKRGKEFDSIALPVVVTDRAMSAMARRYVFLRGRFFS